MNFPLKSAVLIISLALAGCHGDSETPQETASHKLPVTDEASSTAKSDFEKSVTKLPPVNPGEDSQSILGVDTNDNGIPDRAENIAYDGVSLFTSNKHDYDALLAILKAMQPQDPIVPNSIDRNKIYCHYMALSSDVRDAFPLNSLYRSVINNKTRSTAFKKSLKEQAVNTGAEVCHD